MRNSAILLDELTSQPPSAVQRRLLLARHDGVRVALECDRTPATTQRWSIADWVDAAIEPKAAAL